MYKEVGLGYNPMWRQQFSYVCINDDNKGKKKFHKKKRKKKENEKEWKAKGILKKL